MGGDLASDDEKGGFGVVDLEEIEDEGGFFRGGIVDC